MRSTELHAPSLIFGAVLHRSGIAWVYFMNLTAQWRKISRPSGIAAAAIYLALSFFLFLVSTGIVKHLGVQYMGDKDDPLIEIWALAWWPHALAKGLNPFITRILWPPSGYNLACTPSVPGPSLVAWPITALFGPVVSYNLFCLFCPVAAAISAFVLCHYLSRRFWPSLVGGYMFGFSPYMLSHIRYHLFLLFIFPVPLLVLLVLLRFDKRVSTPTFVGCFAALSLFEFLSSAELFATTMVFGSMALILYWLICEVESRRQLWTVVLQIACSLAIVGLLLTPYLYYVLVSGLLAPIYPVVDYSNDLLSFAVPPAVLYFGQTFSSVAARLTLSTIEVAAYLGPGVWVILVLYTQAFWSGKHGKLLLLILLLIGAMSLGPSLRVGGEVVSPAPWWPLSKLPLVDQALPGRFGMYVYLTAGVIVAHYLSAPCSPPWIRAILGIACILFLLPNFPLFRPPIVAHVNMPEFFSSEEYKAHLAQGDNVLCLPYMQAEDCLLWQIKTGYYFRLAAARLTLPPPEFSRWPVLPTLETGAEVLDFGEQFKAFLGAHRVEAVMVDPQSTLPWQQLLAKIGINPLRIGGFCFIKYPPDAGLLQRSHSPQDG